MLSGTEEALLQRKVDLAICSQMPAGFAGDPLMRIGFIAAAHPDHPLHQLGRELTLQDLRKHRHLVIRDTGSQRRSGSWLGAEQIWTVSHKATSIHAAAMGLGFAWFPEDTVRAELERGVLKPLPLREGGERWGSFTWCSPTATTPAPARCGWRDHPRARGRPVSRARPQCFCRVGLGSYDV